VSVMIDRTAIKTNQAVIVALCVIAALARWPALVGLGALLLTLGAAAPGASPILYAYLRWLRPSGLLQPHLVAESAAPHRFAQAMGAACLAAGWALLALGMPVPGWGLVWLVALLASANMAAGFCAGCQIYGFLGRAGIIRAACATPSRTAGLDGSALSPAGSVTLDRKGGAV
jgi:uncharacterized protein DUF4395